MRQQDGGIRATFSSEKTPLRCPEELERAFGLAFAGHYIQLGTEPSGRHYVFIRGLNNMGRAQILMNALHLIHTDGEECPDASLALGWHLDPEGDCWSRTKIGDLVNRSKHKNDEDSRIELGNQLATVVQEHGAMKEVDSIITPPSDHSLAGLLAKRVGEHLGVPVLEAKRGRPVRKQSDDKDLEFEVLYRRQIDTIIIPTIEFMSSVLIVDDVYGTGGTSHEIMRQLRSQLVDRIFVVTATKTRRNHQQI